MTCVTWKLVLTPVTKTQVYLPEEQIALLHRLAKRDRKSVAAIIREAIGAALEKTLPAGPKVGFQIVG